MKGFIMICNINTLTKDLAILGNFYGVERVLVDTTIYDRSRRTFAHKIGRLAGHTKNFFSRQETKNSTLVAYWAFETAFYSTLALMITSSWMFVPIFLFWGYGTYALFSTINNTR